MKKHTEAAQVKIDWNPKYTSAALYAGGAAAFTVACVFVGINLDYVNGALGRLFSILSPVIWGFAIAYLLNPTLRLCERRVFAFVSRRKPHPKLRRGLSMLCTYIFFAVSITLLFALLAPRIAASYNDLQLKMSGYVASAQEFVHDLAEEADADAPGLLASLYSLIDLEAIADKLNALIYDSYNIIRTYSPYILTAASTVLGQVLNFVVGVVFSVYFLASKDKLAAQGKKIICAFMRRGTAEKTLELIRETDKTFGGFIVGKILDSLIIGVLTFIVLAIFKMPYYQLISVIVGVTNVIPFFGPFIGAIPSAFIIFIADPIKALWFVLIILLIQQLDGNLIGPMILGDRTGLSSLWVIVAITVMSGIFGLAGMFIGVPMFSVFYHFVKRFVEFLLRRRGLPAETESYAGSGGDDNEV